MKTNKIIKFILSIALCQGAGLIGSLFTTPSIPTWYASLQKPSFAPPNWLFGPVWITLFTLMGISFYLVWNKSLKNKLVKKGLFVFGIQLMLNTLWSFLFFGLRSPRICMEQIVYIRRSRKAWRFPLKVSFKGSISGRPFVWDSACYGWQVSLQLPPLAAVFSSRHLILKP